MKVYAKQGKGTSVHVCQQLVWPPKSLCGRGGDWNLKRVVVEDVTCKTCAKIARADEAKEATK